MQGEIVAPEGCVTQRVARLFVEVEDEIFLKPGRESIERALALMIARADGLSDAGLRAEACVVARKLSAFLSCVRDAENLRDKVDGIVVRGPPAASMTKALRRAANALDRVAADGKAEIRAFRSSFWATLPSLERKRHLTRLSDRLHRLERQVVERKTDDVRDEIEWEYRLVAELLAMRRSDEMLVAHASCIDGVQADRDLSPATNIVLALPDGR